MSTFGSTTEDADGVPIEKGDGIDRGPPEEDRKTEAELRGQMRDISTAKLTMGEIATVQGIAEENKVLKSMMDDLCEQNNRFIGMVGTMRNELEQFKSQWNIERQSWLANGGSTTPEDN